MPIWEGKRANLHEWLGVIAILAILAILFNSAIWWRYLERREARGWADRQRFLKANPGRPAPPHWVPERRVLIPFRGPEPIQ